MNTYGEQALARDHGLLRARAFRKEYLSIVEGVLIRPRWFRVCVIQEVAVADEVVVICGSKSISWRILVCFNAITEGYRAPVV
jgi:hypothetical protein